MSRSMIRQAMRGNARKKRERKWVENGIRFRTQDLVTAWNNNELKLYVAFCTLFLLSCSQPIIEDAVSRFPSISRKKWLPLQAIRCVTVFFFPVLPAYSLPNQLSQIASMQVTWSTFSALSCKYITKRILSWFQRFRMCQKFRETSALSVRK